MINCDKLFFEAAVALEADTDGFELFEANFIQLDREYRELTEVIETVDSDIRYLINLKDSLREKIALGDPKKIELHNVTGVRTEVCERLSMKKEELSDYQNDRKITFDNIRNLLQTREEFEPDSITAEMAAYLDEDQCF